MPLIKATFARLLFILQQQDFVNDRHLVLDLDLHERIAHGFTDVLCVRGGAAQNHAETDDARKFLSEMKRIWSEYNNGPFNDVVEKIDKHNKKLDKKEEKMTKPSKNAYSFRHKHRYCLSKCINANINANISF